MDEPLSGKPDKLRIPLDKYHFDCVGRFENGMQFMAFVTGAFPDGYNWMALSDDWRNVKRWVGVLHLFDAEGNHIRSESVLGAHDIVGRLEAGEKATAELNQMLEPLGSLKPKLCDIFVRPFSVVLDGVTHGLIYETTPAEEDSSAGEYVMLEPRDIMFHPPWDSGEYST